tara:strand:+ start:891 stop:2252 length:1362 start_codon:yes stop_codon:yes gene_type:complete
MHHRLLKPLFFKNKFQFGILGMDIHIPQLFVSQEKLETFNGVSSGKYTKGLGQRNMAVCDIDEDIQSMALTTTQQLLNKFNIKPSEIGRLEVGTESQIDKSKSVKSTVMSLFNKENIYNVEGIDTINACYGGTQALFNTLGWMHSPEYDGRYGIVLTGDIAVYPNGPARPTGGAGMVGILLGPNAPLTLEPLRHTYVEHAYDFYKPIPDSEYPIVDGHLSNDCYIRALHNCIDGYFEKANRKYQIINNIGYLYEDAFIADYKESGVTDNYMDYAIFHQPYSKLVEKSHAELIDKTTSEKQSKEQIKELFKKQTEISTILGKEMGNLYTGSLYAGLLSNLCLAPPTDIPGSRTIMFSYGSGLVSTMFSLKMNHDIMPWLSTMRKTVNLKERLHNRTEITPEEYTKIMDRRENANHEYLSNQKHLLDPKLIEKQNDSTYYLRSVDPDTYKRIYSM